MIQEIRDGRQKRDDGTRIEPANKDIPAYAYVICDPCPQLQEAIKLTALTPTADGVGWAGHLANFNTYMEVIPYAKLLGDANKRNRILFRKLDIID